MVHKWTVFLEIDLEKAKKALIWRLEKIVKNLHM